ncbi:MAG: hypothetical protein ACRDIY_19295, partial [Chloroflexota bacterium]
LVLYLGAVLCLATDRRNLLAVVVVALLVLNIVGIAGSGIVLLPGTLLLAASAAMARDAGHPRR